VTSLFEETHHRSSRETDRSSSRVDRTAHRCSTLPHEDVRDLAHIVRPP
jgi:hypothetical protein